MPAGQGADDASIPPATVIARPTAQAPPKVAHPVLVYWIWTAGLANVKIGPCTTTVTGALVRPLMLPSIFPQELRSEAEPARQK